MSAGLKAGGEGLNLEDGFFEAGELSENNLPPFDPLKNHMIESWLNYNAIAPQPEPDADTINDDERLPFDIEDDEETTMPSSTQKPALNRFASRLADFDFLYSPPSTSHLQKPMVGENAGDELPFDIDDDEANSLSSDITVRPAVKALDADEADFLQILDDLDEISSSSELDYISSSHTLPDEFLKMPVQTSANLDAPSQTIAEQIPGRSLEILSTCNSCMFLDEILTTSNSASKKPDSVHRSTPEIPREYSKWHISADEIKPEISYENPKWQNSANQLKCKISHQNPKKQVTANEVKSIVQNTETSFSPSNLEPAPVNFIDKKPTTENKADTQHKLPNPPSRYALEPSLHISTEHVFAKEVKSPNSIKNTTLSSKSDLEALLGRRNNKSSSDESKNAFLDETQSPSSDEKYNPSVDEKKNPSLDKKKNPRLDENECSSRDEKKYPSPTKKQNPSPDMKKNSPGDENKSPLEEVNKYPPFPDDNKNCLLSDETKDFAPREKKEPPLAKKKNPPPDENKEGLLSDEKKDLASHENKDSPSVKQKNSLSSENENPSPSVENKNRLHSDDKDDSPLFKKKVPTSDKSQNPLLTKTRALTWENLLELEQPDRFKSPRMPQNQKLETYAAYIQNVWETISSQATSVISKETSRVTHGNPKLTQYSDASFGWLFDFVVQGKAATVRALLECGCNPGTKVS